MTFTRCAPLVAALVLCGSVPHAAAADTTVSLADPAIGTPTTQKLKPAKKSATARKAPAKKPLAVKSARARPVAFGAAESGLELTPPQTEEEAFEWLERDLALKVGKQRQEDDYPAEAVRNGWAGTALVEVLVARNGTIQNVALGRTSGFQILDEQALAMVRRVSKLWVPKRLRGREMNVSVPIGFQLQIL
jgi:protein TonB